QNATGVWDPTSCWLGCRIERSFPPEWWSPVLADCRNCLFPACSLWISERPGFESATSPGACSPAISGMAESRLYRVEITSDLCYGHAMTTAYAEEAIHVHNLGHLSDREIARATGHPRARCLISSRGPGRQLRWRSASQRSSSAAAGSSTPIQARCCASPESDQRAPPPPAGFLLPKCNRGVGSHFLLVGLPHRTVFSTGMVVTRSRRLPELLVPCLFPLDL